jgi:hypothetical protein
MSQSEWEDLYLQTVVEVNGQRMGERIEATRKAIARRLEEMGQNGDDSERQRMKKALNALDTLEVEAKNRFHPALKAEPMAKDQAEKWAEIYQIALMELEHPRCGVASGMHGLQSEVVWKG